MDLSIIIPVYNEHTKIVRDIQAAVAFLQQQNLTGEIIVVDDGSTDGTTDQARNTNPPDSVICRVEHFEINQGKGHAVRHGVLSSIGQAVLFMDSGHCIPLEAALLLLSEIRTGQCHIALGSRHHPDSHITRDQTFYRKLCSTAFRTLLKFMFPQLKPYHDTQCGFKLYHGPSARELFAESHLNGFMFDIEILCLALQKGLIMREFPVTWACDRDSRLSPSRSMVAVMKELMSIKRMNRPTDL